MILISSRIINSNGLSLARGLQHSILLSKPKGGYNIQRTAPIFTGIKRYFEEVRANPELNTTPNIITMSRIIASPLLVAAMVCDYKEVVVGGIVVFAFTDWLDGYIARKYNQQTVMGAFLDPLADKILIGSLSLGLVYKGLLPVPLMVLIVGRDVLLVASIFYIRYVEKPMDAPFFDTTTSATVQMNPSTLSKVNTVLQFAMVGATIGHYMMGMPTIEQLEPLWWITGATTLTSGLSYLNGSGMKRLKEARKREEEDRQ